VAHSAAGRPPVLASQFVQADSVAQVADELYALIPGEFIAARDEQARQARADGQRQTAAEIKKLARPTASAWLVNQLVRSAASQMGRLFELGQSLHDAQRELDGDRIRELSGQRRQILAELLPVAAQLAADAGQPASASVLGEVRATLEAALADSAAGAAVKSGRLTRALAYAGLGEVDLTAAMAVLPGTTGEPASEHGKNAGGLADSVGGRQPGGRQPGGREPGARPRGSEATSPRDGTGATDASRDSKAARAREALSEAEAAAEAAGVAAAQAERLVASLGEQRQFLRRRIEHLQRELDQDSAQDAQLGREVRQAKRDLDAAARTLTTAQRRLALARERAGPG
jgi:hypothetical protein